MDQVIQQLVEYLRGTWRRRWIGLGVAWLVAIVGAVVLFKTPNKYEASARVYVDTQSMLKPLMSGLAFQPDIDQQVSIISRTLISRPNVEKLIRMTDLDLTTHSPGERERLIDGLARQLRLSAARDNIYVISYNHPVPDQAQRVVQALLSIFVESSLGDKRKGTDSARRFIEEQIRAYEKRLEEAENRLKDFKLKHLGLVGPDYFTRLGSSRGGDRAGRPGAPREGGGPRRRSSASSPGRIRCFFRMADPPPRGRCPSSMRVSTR